MIPRPLLAPSLLLALAAAAAPLHAQRPPGGGGGGGGPDPLPELLVGSFPQVAVPGGNPMTPEKVLLGKALFFEEQLSSDDTVSCATCHVLEAGGIDARPRARAPGEDGLLFTPDDEFGSAGVLRQDRLGNFEHDLVFGVERQVTGRSAPSVINAAFFNTQFWDARAGAIFRDLGGNVVLAQAASLETQAVGPPLSALEMARDEWSWEQIVAKLERVRPLQLATDLPAALADFLGSVPTYGALFARAFGDEAITRERIAMAIASYERTLVSDRAPFDLGTLTPHQRLGLDVFRNRGTCESCHPSSNGLFTDGNLHEIHLPWHDRPAKAPGLRNMGLRPAFMSSGQMTDMLEVLVHYENVAAFDPLPGDSEALADFLLNGLTDPRVAANEPPFDRPTLRSEREPVGSNLYGVSTPASSGIAPVMLAHAPPFLGNAEFRIGLGRAARRAEAILLLAARPAAPGTSLLGVPLGVDPGAALRKLVVTTRASDGRATATLRVPLPASTALQGRTFYAQWLVRDPGLAAGFSASEAAAFRMFAR
jgi:cytochrome c peroxidase